MESKIVNRALLLVKQARLVDLEAAGKSNYKRWQNIRAEQAQIRADEIEILGSVFPSYRWWLMTGEVMPEVGQTSPEYDEANARLKQQSEG